MPIQYKMEPELNQEIVKRSHHEPEELCTSRLSYRQGNKLTAVKVYTVNEESQHLLLRGVPALNLQKELKNLCLRYGEVDRIRCVPNYSNDEEAFTQVFHVRFARIQAARFAKRMMDDKSFFGGVLQVCYAPELESVAETRRKLAQRNEEILKRIRQKSKTQQSYGPNTQSNSIEQSATDPAQTGYCGYPVDKRSNVTNYAYSSQPSSSTAALPKVSNEYNRFPKTRKINRTITSHHSNPTNAARIDKVKFKREFPNKFIPSSIKRTKFT